MIVAITEITFTCDCCRDTETAVHPEGYETGFGEKLPDGWEYFRASFRISDNGTIFALCRSCAERIKIALSDLTSANGVKVA